MSSPTPEATSGPKRRATVKRKHTVARVLVASTLVLALVTALASVLFVRHLNGNIKSVDLETALGTDAPKTHYRGNGEPLDILVMGDDSRAGTGNGIDQEPGGGSDTTILVHLSADRKRAYAVSIPRDSIVDRPECEHIPAAPEVLWNEAFRLDGMTCTVRQFGSTTGIQLDHFVSIDFNGFGEMVDAVDGVPVCVPEDIVDKAHGIFVPAGDPSVLTGDQALDYVRARYIGELAQRNDLNRIKRQQAFIAALVRKVKSAGTLSRFDRVVRFLNAATKSLQTDSELDSVTKIAKIALQLQNIGLDKIKFVTVPTEYFPVDSEFSGRLRWTEDATTLWQLLDMDKPLPAALLKDAVSAEPPATSTEGNGGTETPTTTPSPTTPSPTTPSETPTESESAQPEEPAPGVCA